METAISVIEEQEEIQAESIQYPMKAQELALAIKDDESYKDAADFLLTIKWFRKKVEETFADATKKAYDSWKAIVKLRSNADAPLDEAERIIKPALAIYNAEQRKKAKAEQDRLAAEQRKKDEDAKLAKAQSMADAGDHRGAEAVLDAPPAPIAPPPIQKAKVDGISYKDVWKAEVTNLQDLIKAVADGKAPATLLQVNTTALNGLARSLKGELKYPGVRVWSESEVAARSR